MNSSAPVVFVAPEPVSESVTGPAHRSVKLAEAVAAHCPVTLVAPAPSVFPDGPFRALEIDPTTPRELATALEGHDVAVVQPMPSPRQLLVVRKSVPRLVVDLIAPLALEVAEIPHDGATTRAMVRWLARAMVTHLAVADLVLCSNEKQRDLLIGVALSADLLKPGATSSLEDRIAIVPHGVEEGQPPSRRSCLRANGFATERDRVAVWGGGIWSWLDPLTAIRAVERLRPARPDVKLAFVGLESPDPDARRAHAPRAAEARRYVQDHDLEQAVGFLPQWLPRDDFLAHLRDADVGVSLHGPTLEGRFASRTRVVDYLTAGLPVVCTRGDAMSELVDSLDVGISVPPGDVEACAAALDRLTRDHSHCDTRKALEPLLWRNVAEPLIEFCLSDRRAGETGWRVLSRVARDYPRFLHAVYRTEGGSGLMHGAFRRGAALLPRRG